MTMSLIAGVAAFVLTVLAMPHFITYYKIKKIGGQQMHEDVKQHLAKAGTPTMGGTVFLVVAILVSLIFNFHVFSEGHQAYGATVGILFVILIYGIIGFLDDFLKIFRQINEGLKPSQKMALQIIAGLLFYFIHVLPSGGGERRNSRAPAGQSAGLDSASEAARGGWCVFFAAL